MFIDRIIRFFRRLQWKLTLSYASVTVGTLSIIVLILGYLLFSNVYVPINILNQVMTPESWIQAMIENQSPAANYVLSKKPIDTKLINLILQEDLDLQITYFDLFHIGDFQVRVRTIGQGVGFLVDPDTILLGSSNPDFLSEDAVGKPLDMEILPGLEKIFQAALSGEIDPDRVMVTIEPNERFYFAVPYFDESGQNVLAVGILYVESLPTADDIPEITLMLFRQSVLVLLFAAGLIGTIFGALTARGMVKRLVRISHMTDSWSQGDFSEFIDDPAGDEISQLTVRLNNMAKKLRNFLKRSQEMAVSEERNRLARDLHDSAKQEALAASFHLGTALELFERDPVDVKNHLIEADRLVDSVRRELTDLIHELRPISMNGNHFDETLNEYIIEWAHQTGIGTTFNAEGLIDLSLELKQAIYRIMQESLANVSRHSSANQVKINLEFLPDTVKFSISDDGVGFDIQQQHDGMGLDSMRERAESHKGFFNIESEVEQGTRVCVTFPIE